MRHTSWNPLQLVKSKVFVPFINQFRDARHFDVKEMGAFVEDPKFIEQLDWSPFHDQQTKQVRKNLAVMTIVSAIVFWGPAYSNYLFALKGNVSWSFFYSKLAVRSVSSTVFVAIFFLVRSRLHLSPRQMTVLVFLNMMAWFAFFTGLLVTTVMFTPVDHPELVPMAVQLFFGVFGGIALLTQFFALSFRMSTLIGITGILIYYKASMWAGVIGPTTVQSYVGFLVGATLFTAMASRRAERLRRNDYISRKLLAQSNDQMKELDRLKTKFFSNISHELRTPLTMILGPLEGVLSSKAQASEGMLQSIAANSRRLLRQVNLILDFSKIEAGKMELALSHANVGTLLQELINASMPHAARCQVNLVGQGLDKISTTKFDINKVETIAANLISNALKFTPRGGTVTIGAREMESTIVFFVQDTGPGIPKESLSKLFQRFSQVESASAKTLNQGTGLGLSMVRDFARLHGGDAKVESDTGKGAIFTVEIPKLPKGSEVLGVSTEAITNTSEAPLISRDTVLLSDVESHVQDVDSERLEVESFNTQSTANFDRSLAVVLFADDNKELRQYVSGFLAKKYNVYLAINGQHGFEVANRVKPDLILSDFSMPVLTGAEFCRKIRDHKELKEVPFVLLTAKDALSSKLEGLNSGADDYVSKPFSEEEVAARIRNLVILRRNQVQLKKDLASARRIQFSLLPASKQNMEGFEFDFLYQPCDSLSGDFFEIIKRPEGTLFYVADITSHGVASAQVTYLVKGIFGKLLTEQKQIDIPEIAKCVAREYAAYKLEYSMCLFLAFLKNDGTLIFLRSGFPDPVVINGDKVRYLDDTPNPLIDTISFDEKEQFIALQTVLEPADQLFVFTDGAYELVDQRSRKPYGIQRFSKVLMKCSNDLWHSTLKNSLIEVHGYEDFPDDMTVLRLKKAS